MTTDAGDMFEIDESGHGILVAYGVGGPEYTYLDEGNQFDARATWSTVFHRPVILTHHVWCQDGEVMIHVPMLDHEPKIEGFEELKRPCEYTEAVRCNYLTVYSEEALSMVINGTWAPHPEGVADDPAL